MFSRRYILQMLGWSAAGSVLGRPHLRAAATMGLGADSVPAFEEVPAKTCGISWIHDSGPSPDMYLPETTGPGCAFLDYDNDGWMDIYLVNSGPCDFYKPRVPIRNALYRNNRDGTFTDVTEKAGVPGNAYGMGIAVGDYDGDGWPDLYVSQYSRSILYHNNGDGTFADVTEKAGVAAPGMATSAVWFDYDNDGRLDLFVGRFGNFEKATNIVCMSGMHSRVYCKPTPYLARPCYLFHNNGDGTFTDVSKSSGVGLKPGNGLGIVTFDYDNDGWQDIFISNDAMPNFLFHNNHDGTFSEVGYQAGVAVSMDGEPESGMGTDAADLTGSGRLDIAVGHLENQLARLYRNMGDQVFEDATLLSKIGYSTYHMSEFGLRFMDYDNDGACDLFMAAGHVLDNIHLYNSEVYYAEPKLMYRNLGNGTFENVSDKLGPDFHVPRVSRGAAVGDFDNDGDLDILVNHCGQAPQLLRNDGGNANHWLEILLIGTRSNRDGVGARVKVTAGKLVIYGQRKGGMSYQSAQDPRLHFGLGQNTKVDAVEIRWPSGVVTGLSNLQSDQIIAVKEGEGLVARPFPCVPPK